MKKLVLSLIAILAIVFVSVAQTPEPTSVPMGLTTYTVNLKFVARDTIWGTKGSAADSIWNVYINKENIKPLKYSIKLEVDKVTGTPKAKFRLFARIHASDSWVRLDSCVYGGSADSNIVFTQTTTAQHYNYFRIETDATLTSSEQAYRYTYIRVRFWE